MAKKPGCQKIDHPLPGDEITDGMESRFLTDGIKQPVQRLVPEISPQVMLPGELPGRPDQTVLRQLLLRAQRIGPFPGPVQQAEPPGPVTVMR